jgi:hypothetical protein
MITAEEVVEQCTGIAPASEIIRALTSSNRRDDESDEEWSRRVAFVIQCRQLLVAYHHRYGPVVTLPPPGTPPAERPAAAQRVRASRAKPSAKPRHPDDPQHHGHSVASSRAPSPNQDERPYPSTGGKCAGKRLPWLCSRPRQCLSPHGDSDDAEPTSG